MKNIISSKIFLYLSLMSVILFIFFESKALQIPLLDGHSMKTSVNIEVAYNMVRYNDFTHQYVDYYATPENPKGYIGNLLYIDSPLSSILLGFVYKIISESSNLNSRIQIARIFSLFHILISYFLICTFIFKKKYLYWLIYSILFLFSSIGLYQSTRPMAETFAFLYQAIYIISLFKIINNNKISIKTKIIILFFSSILFCLGGKINYFFVCAPIILCFPFVDKNFNKLNKINYFIFLFFLTLTSFLLLHLINFKISDTIKFFITGNLKLINNSYVQTFFEGFKSVPMLIKRIWFEYGPPVALLGGSFFIITTKTIFINKNKKPINLLMIIYFLIIGYITNYVFLRNLYIPHQYYIYPTYMIFCLASIILIQKLIELYKKRNIKNKSILLSITSLILIILIGFHIKYSFQSYYGFLGDKNFYINLKNAIDIVRKEIPDNSIILSPNDAISFYANKNSLPYPKIEDIEYYKTKKIEYYLTATWAIPSEEFLKYLNKVTEQHDIILYKIK